MYATLASWLKSRGAFTASVCEGAPCQGHEAEPIRDPDVPGASAATGCQCLGGSSRHEMDPRGSRAPVLYGHEADTAGGGGGREHHAHEPCPSMHGPGDRRREAVPTTPATHSLSPEANAVFPPATHRSARTGHWSPDPPPSRGGWAHPREAGVRQRPRLEGPPLRSRTGLGWAAHRSYAEVPRRPPRSAAARLGDVSRRGRPSAPH